MKFCKYIILIINLLQKKSNLAKEKDNIQNISFNKKEWIDLREFWTW